MLLGQAGWSPALRVAQRGTSSGGGGKGGGSGGGEDEQRRGPRCGAPRNLIHLPQMLVRPVRRGVPPLARFQVPRPLGAQAQAADVLWSFRRGLQTDRCSAKRV